MKAQRSRKKKGAEKRKLVRGFEKYMQLVPWGIIGVGEEEIRTRSAERMMIDLEARDDPIHPSPIRKLCQNPTLPKDRFHLLQPPSRRRKSTSLKITPSTIERKEIGWLKMRDET